MPFKKGEVSNPKGKKRGTKNKKTQQWETFNEYILNGGLEKYQEEMDKLKGKEYIHAFQNQFEYHKPKQSRAEIDQDNSGELIIRIIKDGSND